MTIATVFAFAAGMVAVVDGDGLKGITTTGAPAVVRLWGIDAPEVNRGGGAAAKARLAEIIAGQALRCEVRGPESYGRKVAQCWTAAGADLACEMVAAGMAFDWPKFSGGAYAACEGRADAVSD